MKMTDRKKKATAAGLAVLAAVLLFGAVFLVSLVPRTVYWSGTAGSANKEAPASADLTLELERHGPLFGKLYFTGSVTVDGRRYEDIHAYEYPLEPFIPAERRADFGGSQLEIYRDCVILEEDDGLIRVTVRGQNGPNPVYEIDPRR